MNCLIRHSIALCDSLIRLNKQNISALIRQNSAKSIYQSTRICIKVTKTAICLCVEILLGEVRIFIDLNHFILLENRIKVTGNIKQPSIINVFFLFRRTQTNSYHFTKWSIEF